MKRISRKVNLVGNKYGRLTVIKYIGIVNNKDRNWQCICDCGKYKNVITSSLTKSKTSSCGCLSDEVRKNKPNQYKLPIGHATRNVILYTYKQNAHRKNLKWELTDDFAFKLFKNNCACCGIEPCINKKHKNSNGYYIYNGIDRIDNTKGYLYNNVQTLCKRCNIAKNNMTQKEFISWIKRIVENNK